MQFQVNQFYQCIISFGFDKNSIYLKRYYATFKKRKFELFYKVTTSLQRNPTCIGFQAEEIFTVNIKYTYFFNFRLGFCSSFSMFFPKAPASCGWTNFEIVFFLYCTFICMSSKSVSYFKSLISNCRYKYFCLSWCFFSRYVQLKNSI